MEQLSHLRSMWNTRMRRSTELIVPCITSEDGELNFNNASWAFNVTFAFRDSLDIKYEERRKNKRRYMVWTQGPILSFKEGDVFHRSEGVVSLQITSAAPMGWDTDKEHMYEGSVTFSEYNDGLLGSHTCTQMQFLKLLIAGAY